MGTTNTTTPSNDTVLGLPYWQGVLLITSLVIQALAFGTAVYFHFKK
jgi:hypothetical protein